MNKAERKAREAYNRNKNLNIETMTTKERFLLCKKQDAFYKTIHARADKKYFSQFSKVVHI